MSKKEQELVATIECAIAALSTAIIPSTARETQLKDALRFIERAILQNQSLPQSTDELSVAESETESTLSFLFAMDNELLRKVISSMITKRGHQVTTIDNPDEVVSQLGSDKFDLVLIDMTDSSTEQIERLKRIRLYDEEQMDHTPVIALTAEQTAIDDSFDEWVGLLDAYLPAPIGSDRFFFTVERVLARSASWS